MFITPKDIILNRCRSYLNCIESNCKNIFTFLYDPKKITARSGRAASNETCQQHLEHLDKVWYRSLVKTTAYFINCIKKIVRISNVERHGASARARPSGLWGCAPALHLNVELARQPGRGRESGTHTRRPVRADLRNSAGSHQHVRRAKVIVAQNMIAGNGQ